MPRKRRVIRAGHFYHVMLRGVGGRTIFMDDVDRCRFCLLLQYAVERSDLTVHGFCLMDNHVHLIVQPSSNDLSNGIHRLAFRYAQYFNSRMERVGYLFQGRYKAVLVQTGTYLRRLVRYVHRNPLRAGMVADASSYSWSSQHAYSGKTDITWLQTTPLLKLFASDIPTARKMLIDYVDTDDESAKTELNAIRKATSSGVYGDTAFVEMMAEEVDQPNLQPLGSLVPLETVIDHVCGVTDTCLEALQSSSRARPLVAARAALVSVCQRMGVSSPGELAQLLQRDPTSISRLNSKADVTFASLRDQVLNELVETPT